MIDLARLRELCGQASPGPWDVREIPYARGVSREVLRPNASGDGAAICKVYAFSTPKDRASADAAYIAALNPSVVLALLDRIEEAERRLAKLKSGICTGCAHGLPLNEYVEGFHVSGVAGLDPQIDYGHYCDAEAALKRGAELAKKQAG